MKEFLVPLDMIGEALISDLTKSDIGKVIVRKRVLSVLALQSRHLYNHYQPCFNHITERIQSFLEYFKIIILF